MRPIGVRPWLRGLVSAAALALAGCNAGSGESTLGNFIAYGGPTAPPIAPAAVIDVPDCPPVDVADGGSSLRSGGREGGAVRSQISIANVARECAGRPDGSVVVKVGIQGRALAGPGGSVARTDVPVFVRLKRGDRILASATRRVAVAVEPGGMQGSFVVVEEGLVVPPGIGGEFEIEVGLGGAPGARAPARRRSRG